MSSTHEPAQLLEPSNLLEPLDLSEYPRDRIHPATGADRGASPQRFTRHTSGPSARERRSFVKPILIVAGALACFGAGTAIPQLQTLTRGTLVPEPTVTNASRPSPQIAEGAAISDEAKPIEAKPSIQPSNESKPPANESSQAATNATGTAPAAASAAQTKDSAAAQPAQPAQAASAGKNAVADCAAPCNQQLCPKDDANCLEGGPGPATTLTSTDGSVPTRMAQPAREAPAAEPEGAQTRASNRQEEHAQSSRRSKRAAQRETTTARRNAATLSRSSRGQDPKQASTWQRDFASVDGMPTGNSSGWWQDRDSSQASNRWRDRLADDNVPAARSSSRGDNLDQAPNWRRERGAESRWEERDSTNWRRDRGEGRWQERDSDRASNRRRDRDVEYSRDDDRRFRAGRNDDLLTGRAERSEGPQMFPAGRYR
jgi:hypothetical protein